MRARLLILASALAASLAVRCLFPSVDGLSTVDAATDAPIGDALGDGAPLDASDAGTITWVQQVTAAPTPPGQVALPAALTAGDSIVICAAYRIELGSIQITDSLNQTFTLMGSQDGTGRMNNYRQVMFAAFDVAGGLDTLQITTSSTTVPDGGANFVEIYAFEYRGISSVDTTLTSAGAIDDASADVWASWGAGSIMTANPNELLVAFVEGYWGATLDPGFTTRTNFHNNAVGDQLAATPGAHAVTGTADNNWASITAAFNP